MHDIPHLPLTGGAFEVDGGGVQEFVHNARGQGFERVALLFVQWSELVQSFIEFLQTNRLGMLPQRDNRRHGVTPKTYYRWKAKFGGMDVSDARRLKQLEEENRKLKQLLAEATLDNHALKELLRKNG